MENVVDLFHTITMKFPGKRDRKSVLLPARDTIALFST